MNIDIGKSRKEKNPNGATVQLDPAQKIYKYTFLKDRWQESKREILRIFMENYALPYTR